MSHNTANDGGSGSILTSLGKLLDKAVQADPRVQAAWGLVGIAAAAAIIAFILGLNRLTFIAMIAMFLGMVLIPVVSGIKSDSRVVKLASGTTVIVVVGAVAVFVVMSLAAGITCKPRPFVHFLGLQDACYEPPTRLRISNFKLFDEAHRQGTGANSVLTNLAPRSGYYYEIGEAESFAIVVGFVVRGVEARGNQIELELTIAGLGAPGAPSAWEQKITLYSLDDWKTKFKIPQKFGADVVLRELGLKEGDGIPVTGIISCFKPHEITRWSGSVVISAYDYLANIGARHNPIAFQTKIDPIKLGASQTCT
jgi:hypothetical protein